MVLTLPNSNGEQREQKLDLLRLLRIDIVLVKKTVRIHTAYRPEPKYCIAREAGRHYQALRCLADAQFSVGKVLSKLHVVCPDYVTGSDG